MMHRGFFIPVLCAAMLLGAQSATSQQTSSPLRSFTSSAELSSYLRAAVLRHQQWERDRDAREHADWLKTNEGKLCDPVSTKSNVKQTVWRSASAVRSSRVALFGSVRDPAGNSLPGANVTLPEKQIGAGTDANGAYRVQIDRARLDTGNALLVVRRIGYVRTAERIDLTSIDSIRVDVTLCMDRQQLIGVVVVGMGGFPGVDEFLAPNTNDPEEGGMAKMRGEQIIVLNRDRLFSIDTRGGKLKPVSAISAIPSTLDPQNSWSRELFVTHDKAIVIGFNDKISAREIHVYSIDSAGVLSYTRTYQLREPANYRTESDYRARLIGNRLYLSTELDVFGDSSQIDKAIPSMRTWHAGATERDFRQIASPSSMYRPVTPIDGSLLPVVHSLVTCDIETTDFKCSARGIISAPATATRLSGTSVSIWTGDPARSTRASQKGFVYRLPTGNAVPVVSTTSGAIDHSGNRIVTQPKTKTLPFQVDRIDTFGTERIASGFRKDTVYFANMNRRSTLKSHVAVEADEYPSVAGVTSTRNSNADLILGYIVRDGHDSDINELSRGAASAFFVRKSGDMLNLMGEVKATIPTSVEDGCTAGCFDWFGNAGVLYRGSRAFAVFGYEVVEVNLGSNSIDVVQRVDMAPRSK